MCSGTPFTVEKITLRVGLETGTKNVIEEKTIMHLTVRSYLVIHQKYGLGQNSKLTLRETSMSDSP